MQNPDFLVGKYKKLLYLKKRTFFVDSRQKKFRVGTF